MASTQASGWRRLLLIVHIVATVGTLGTDLVLMVLGISGVQGSDPRTIYPAAQLVGQWLIMPMALLSLLTGLIQGFTAGYGLVRYWWVAIKLVITVLLTGLVLFVLVPALGRAADTAEATGALADSNRLPLLLAPIGASALLIVAVALAVVKPRWRLASGRGD